MLINDREYQVLMDIEDITHTNYGIKKIEEDTYFIPEDGAIVLMEDLRDAYYAKLEERNNG